MRILVTGATGFLGRPVCETLLAQGYQVVAAVRRPDADVFPGVEIRVVGDIDGTTDWSAALDGVDAVLHLAGRAHVMQETLADPLVAFRAVNRDGTVTLARACVAQGIKRLVFVSSIKVNGEETASGKRFRGDDKPAPEDDYGLSKYEAEQGLSQVASGSGLEIVIVRPPLIVGRGAKGNLAQLKRLTRKGLPLPLGSINNLRSLVGVRNLADALAFLLRTAEASGGTYLVRDDEDVSTPELIRRLARAQGCRARLIAFPVSLLRLAGWLTGRSALVRRVIGSLAVDDQPLRNLGWVPPYSLDHGLLEMAEIDHSSAML